MKEMTLRDLINTINISNPAFSFKYDGIDFFICKINNEYRVYLKDSDRTTVYRGICFSHGTEENLKKALNELIIREII